MSLIDQLPPSIEWRVYSGDTAKLTLFVRDANDKPIDLSDYTVVGQIKATPSGNSADANLQIEVGEEGVISVGIEDTTAIDEQVYFDIQTTSPDDVVNTILRGLIIKEQDVTN
jgi:hypothetical protein